MARVVYQRSAPPYLLIVAVFLFLVAAVLAVLQYMEADELDKKLQDISAERDRLASEQELNGAAIRKMFNRYDNPPRGERAKTVVTQLAGQQEMLTRLIVGTPSKPAEALSKADAAYAQLGSRRGLVTEVLDLHATLIKERERIADLNRLKEDLQARLSEKNSQVSRMTAEFASDLAKRDKKVQLIERDYQAHLKAHEQQLAGAKSDWNQARLELEKLNVTKTTEIVELQESIGEKNETIDKLQSRIRTLTRTVMKKDILARQPDGKVELVVENSKICYVDIGSRDRVVPGLTFSVYGPEGISESGDGKAKIVVTNVSDNVSECRVQQQDRENPLAMGDLIANLAFDPTRTYKFVVEGNFDLHGKGRPLATGRDEVKNLIKQSGGKIMDSVDIETDFVIMGARSPEPLRPMADAGPTIWQTYQDQMSAYNRYNEIKTLAMNMNKLVMNTNQFIAFMGYTPHKTLKQ